jgi:hypothetical protein
VFVRGKPLQPSRVRQGAYLSVEHLKRHSRLKRFARDKRSSLLRKFVRYGRKKFYTLDPVGAADGRTASRCPAVRRKRHRVRHPGTTFIKLSFHRR